MFRPPVSLLALLLGLALPLAPAAAAPPRSETAPLHLTGSIRPPVSAGVLPALTVELYPAWEERSAALERLAGRAPAPLAVARPDAAGRFALAAPQPGAYRVEVRAAGSVPMALELPALVEDAQLAPLTLEPAARLEVLAAGPDGQPAGGIEIRAEAEVQPGQAGWGSWRPAVRTGRTGPDGRLVLPRAAGEAVRLTVLTPARLMAEPMTPAGAGGGVARLALPGPRPVVLAAVDGAGRPVAGALLRLAPAALPLGVTGPDGRLEIAAPVRQDLRLLLEDGQGRLAEVAVSPREAGRKTPLTVRLEEPAVVRGRVLGLTGPGGVAGTGGVGEGSRRPAARPLAGALVAPFWELGTLGAPVRTAVDGTFELRLPRGRTARLHAAAAGHLALQGQPLRQRAGPSAPGGSAAAGTELLLKPTASLAGEVVDEAGRPVAGALLWTPLAWGSTASAWSGRDGSFRLAGLLPGGVYQLTVVHGEYPRAVARLRTAALGRPAAPARIVLGAGRTLVGQVVDGDGQPLPGAELTLRRPMVSDEVWQELPADAEAARRAATDRAGRFRLPRVGGRYDLTVRRPGSAPLELPVEVAPGAGDLDLGPLVLPAGLALEGRVVSGQGGEGQPLPGAEVTWVRLGPDGSYPAAVADDRLATDEEGRFRIADLAPGQRLDLTVRHPAHATRKLPRVPAAEGGEPLEIALAAARALAGRVLGPAGEPVAGAQLYSSRIEASGLLSTTSSGRDLIGHTEPDGRFRATGLAPGPLDLQVTAPGYQARDVEGLAIPADRDLEGLEVKLEKGAALEGRVTRRNGEPAGGAQVFARRDFLASRGRPRGGLPGAPPRPYRPSFGLAVTAPDGSYHIDTLDAGPHRVEVQTEQGSASEVAELTSGVHRLDLVLNEAERAASVAGRVVDEEGVPVAGAEIRLGNPAGSWSGTSTLPDGSFVLEQVRPGTHQLSAHGSGILDPEPGRQLQVAGEPIEGVELRVARTEGVTLTGRLLGLTPEEARWVRIDAWQSLRFDHYVPGAVEAPDGYRIAGLHPGSWTVVAVHADGRRAEGTVELGPEPIPPGLDLEFSSGFTLRGRATLDGAPFAGAEVEIAPSDPQGGLPVRQARAGQDGTFAFTHLRHGRYRLFAVDERSGVGAGMQVAVEGDATVRVNVTTAPLHGRVLAADGTPVEGATLLLLGRDDALGIQFRVPPVRTDGDGAFGLPRLATGAYRATVEAEGFAPRELDVQVRPDAGPLEIRLAPTVGG